ncbi:MAG: hypothetical protein QHG99_08505 [Methanomicrobiales archaeon]|nr:hypothetical protein [Methanomicrobiales archaeon]
MICKAGFLWDSPQLFNRYLQDCSICCETITPQLLAAPFFRGQYVALIIPTGFANRTYSRLLPALRSQSGRFQRFVERGGRLLVFGAADQRPDAYDWLWFRTEYAHSYAERKIVFESNSAFPPLVDESCSGPIATDGCFTAWEGERIAATEKGEVVMFSHPHGEGAVVLTTIHEYPSRKFVAQFCCGERETLF